VGVQRVEHVAHFGEQRVVVLDPFARAGHDGLEPAGLGHRLATDIEGVNDGAQARERIEDDDALLAEMSNVLDSLYAHFQRDGERGKGKRTAD